MDRHIGASGKSKMTLENSQRTINIIFGDAYGRAFSILEWEIKRYLIAHPEISEYVHAVGWGAVVCTG